MKIEQGGLRQHLFDDFHRGLKKSAQKTLRLFHSYAQARRRLIYQPIFKRQRSTLSMLFFGPKNGEHLRSPKRELRVLSIERLKGDALKVELAVVSALREYRDQNGRVHPVVSAGLKGSQCGRFRASHASRGLAVGHTRTMAAA